LGWGNVRVYTSKSNRNYRRGARGKQWFGESNFCTVFPGATVSSAIVIVSWANVQGLRQRWLEAPVGRAVLERLASLCRAPGLGGRGRAIAGQRSSGVSLRGPPWPENPVGGLAGDCFKPIMQSVFAAHAVLESVANLGHRHAKASRKLADRNLVSPHLLLDNQGTHRFVSCFLAASLIRSHAQVISSYRCICNRDKSREKT